MSSGRRLETRTPASCATALRGGTVLAVLLAAVVAVLPSALAAAQRAEVSGPYVRQMDPPKRMTRARTFTVTTPPGNDCFDPDCTICAIADDLGQVAESVETNNQLCRTTLG